ncbi:hypothetical protein [Saccharibacillus qingshengii]|nr:hypothetical protein [Saccharibacillus qingshengii]
MEHVAIEPDFEQIMLDTTIVRVHQHGTGAKGDSTSKRSDVPEAD